MAGSLGGGAGGGGGAAGGATAGTDRQDGPGHVRPFSAGPTHATAVAGGPNDSDIPVAALVAPGPGLPPPQYLPAQYAQPQQHQQHPTYPTQPAYPQHRQHYPSQHYPPQHHRQQQQQLHQAAPYPYPYPAPHQLPQAEAVAVPQHAGPVQARIVTTTVRTTHRHGAPPPAQRVVVRTSQEAAKFHSCSAVVFGFGWCIPLIWAAGYCMLCVPKQTAASRCLNGASSVLFTLVAVAAVVVVLVLVVFPSGSCDSSDWTSFKQPCAIANQACRLDQCTTCPSAGSSGCVAWAELSASDLDDPDTVSDSGYYSCLLWC